MDKDTSELQGGHLLPCYSCVMTPGGTARVVSDPTLMEVTPRGGIRPWNPVVAPEVASPKLTPKRPGPSQRPDEPAKKSRRSLQLTEIQIQDLVNASDSGSEGDADARDCDLNNFGESDDEAYVRLHSANLIENPERTRPLLKKLREEAVNVESESDIGSDESGALGPTAGVNNSDFVWSEDFQSFDGQKEHYSRVPGPTFYSKDPQEIFEKIWDPEIMTTIAKETNLYAWQEIAHLSDPDLGSGIPEYLNSWTEVTVDELFRYFAVIIIMSFCFRSKIRDYWFLGILGSFKNIMSRNRFVMISKFLHFVDNEDLVSSGYNRKIAKIAPVLEHCNRKFAELYIPSQHLSLDESLLLWKGRLSWKQCIRSKAARFGIKSFELCDSENGYLLQSRLYTGKLGVMHPDTLHGFRHHTAKVVLDLMDGYLDVGHVLVMDNWYNQLPLTRYLKTRRTDVLGTVNRRHQGIPLEIKDLDPKRVARGTTVCRHSGDIALIAWKDVKLVTVLSTYHQNLMVPGKRAGKAVQKPIAVHEYNQYMGGVDRKDQMLSMFLLERKKCKKWYIKVFKRLLNTSLLNAYIVYKKNPMYKVHSHREFRMKIAEGLLNRYPRVCPGPSRAPVTAQLRSVRLGPGNHFPIYTEMATSGSRKGHKQLRCVRCSVQKLRVSVQTLCELCKVPLCLGKCWREYHTMAELK